MSTLKSSSVGPSNYVTFIVRNNLTQFIVRKLLASQEKSSLRSVHQMEVHDDSSLTRGTPLLLSLNF